MTETPDFDFGSFEAKSVEKLREKRIPAVPPAIVKHAQRAVDGVPDPLHPGQVKHTLEYEFPSQEIAVAFAKHIRNAGHHTHPVSTVAVVVDPEGVAKGSPVNPRLVRWNGGTRKGKKGAKSGQAPE